MPWAVRGQDGSFDQVNPPTHVSQPVREVAEAAEQVDLGELMNVPKQMLPQVSLLKYEPSKSLINQALNG